MSGPYLYLLSWSKHNSFLRREKKKSLVLLVCAWNISSCCHVSIPIIEGKLNLIITRGKTNAFKELICIVIRELRKSSCPPFMHWKVYSFFIRSLWVVLGILGWCCQRNGYSLHYLIFLLTLCVWKGMGKVLILGLDHPTWGPSGQRQLGGPRIGGPELNAPIAVQISESSWTVNSCVCYLFNSSFPSGWRCSCFVFFLRGRGCWK